MIFKWGDDTLKVTRKVGFCQNANPLRIIGLVKDKILSFIYFAGTLSGRRRQSRAVTRWNNAFLWLIDISNYNEHGIKHKPNSGHFQ